MLIPIAIVVLTLIILGATYLSTGSPVHLGVEFTEASCPVPTTESEVRWRHVSQPTRCVRDKESAADRWLRLGR